MPPGRRAAPFPRALLFLGCYVKGTKEGEESREKAHEAQAEANSDFTLEMALQDVYLHCSFTITSILDLGSAWITQIFHCSFPASINPQHSDVRANGSITLRNW